MTTRATAPCMAPGCTHHGRTVLVVRGQSVVLCEGHVAQVRAQAQGAAVQLVQAVERRVPGFTELAARALHVVRALREPLPAPKEEPIVVEAKVVS